MSLAQSKMGGGVVLALGEEEEKAAEGLPSSDDGPAHTQGAEVVYAHCRGLGDEVTMRVVGGGEGREARCIAAMQRYYGSEVNVKVVRRGARKEIFLEAKSATGKEVYGAKEKGRGDKDYTSCILAAQKAFKESPRKAKEFLLRAIRQGGPKSTILARVNLAKLERSVALKPQAAVDLLQPVVDRVARGVEELMARIELGLAMRDAGMHEKALQCLDIAVSLVANAPPAEREALPSLHDLKVAMSRSLYVLGFQQEAADLVMGVVREDEQHFEGLVEYARIAVENGMLSDGVPVLLRLLVRDRNNQPTRTLLAQAASTGEGIRCIETSLSASKGIANAMAFIGTSIKEVGATDATITLYEKAVEHAPENPSIVLNYIHALELHGRIGEIISATVAYCAHVSETQIGAIFPAEICQHLLNMPQPRSRIVKGKKFDISWYDTEEWVSPDDGEKESTGNSEAADCIEYSPVELDCLALLFTVVKILFIGGALRRALEVSRLVDKASRASKTQLHRTSIKNEAAYFTCAKDILDLHPPPAFGKEIKAPKPLYVAGDSHCLPLAWRHVELDGEVRVLKPLLVTGMKLWHLRESSSFYPKRGFEHVMEPLPTASQAVFIFGEIDCREGLLLAVEKCRYENLEQAMEAVVDIYEEVLKRFVDREVEIFVHPPPPVLDQTRAVVIAFSLALRRRIESLQRKKAWQCKGRPLIHYLDISSNIISSKGTLKKEFSFDGTHLSPAYLSVLQEALRKTQMRR